MSKQTVVNELHRQVRKNYPRRRVIQKGINDTWQIDLVEMIPYAHINQGYKYLLTVIDIFSKYAYAKPIKKKSGKCVTEAMREIITKNKKQPKNIHSDRGKEFFNKDFKNLMDEKKINHYNTFTDMKASICERFNRTLKSKMWKMFSMHGNYKWTQYLDELITSYNNTYHRTIKMKPNEVTQKVEKKLLKSVYNNPKIFKMGKFKLGDSVRISKFKKTFDKGYQINWSAEIFQIHRINLTHPITYQLKDHKNANILGCFYEFELQKVKNKNLFLVEKILKRRGNKVYVKWLGFNDSENSWIEKNEFIK